MYKFSQKPVETLKVFTKHRSIVTAIPAPSTIETLEECNKYEPASMNNQLPIVWDKAVDYQIFDDAGNCWIDFTSSIFVANVGHANPKVCNAIKDTLDKKLLNAYYYPTKERAKFSKLLIENTPKNIEKVLLLSTGSEAVEAAIKMAIKYTKKNEVLSFKKSFHGKTMGAQLAGGKPGEKEWIPIKSYVNHIEFPYPWILEQKKMTGAELFDMTFKDIDPKKLAAVITEPYQGWCAAFLPKDYAQNLQKWCNKNEVLLIMDEVQAGFGRTGELFAFNHFDIAPDIITCGKGISSSLPLSAVLTRSRIANIDESFNSTHGGNPMAVAASYASLQELINKKLILASKNKGKILNSELNKWKKEKPQHISRIICKGLLASVFITSPNGDNNTFVDKLIEIAMRKGLMSVRTASGTLKIGPPLTIPEDALIEEIEILKESLQECLDI